MKRFLLALVCLFPLVAHDIQIKTLQSTAIAPYIEQLTQFCLAEYKQAPYYYEGTVDEYRPFLERYTQSEHGLVTLLLSNNQLVGFVAGLPLSEVGVDDYLTPFKEQQISTESYFYLGEFLIKKEYMLQYRWALYAAFQHHVIVKKFKNICVCELPTAYQANYLWKDVAKFTEHPELKFTREWTTFPDNKLKKHTLVYWTKSFVGKLEDLVDLRAINPNIRIEPRYATNGNFAGEPLYDYGSIFLHKDAAAALNNVQKELETYGLGLLVWDGYRAKREQRLMYQKAVTLGGLAASIVSNPDAGGGQKSWGVDVELTIVNKDGTPLEMPTDFDDMTTKAYSNYDNLPQHIRINRTLLAVIMRKHGFMNFAPEWWYWFLPNKTKFYPPIDATVQELLQLSKKNAQ